MGTWPGDGTASPTTKTTGKTPCPHPGRTPTSTTNRSTTGGLAIALNRKTRTLRDWEQRHWLPRSPILQHGITDLTDPANPIEDPRGRRYLYTHQMIQDARHIAFEEDLLETTGVNLDDSGFPERVRQAWAIPEPDPDAIIDLAAMTTEQLAAYNEAENLARHQRTTKIVEFPAPDLSPRYDPHNPFCQRR